MGNKRLERMDMREVDVSQMSSEQFEILEGKVKAMRESIIESMPYLDKAVFEYE